MFDRYIIGKGSVRNVTVDDRVVGFAFDTRIAYYRGLGVSMVEPFEVRIDGSDPVPVAALRFTLGQRTWTFDELAEDPDSRWELTETATLTVLTEDGLSPGQHELDVTECLRISYLPFPSRTRFTRTVSIA